MAQQTDDIYNDTEKNTTATGTNLPDSDGTVSDEDVNSIGQANKEGKPIGQDHSLENYEDSMPTGGVGAVQDGNIIGSDVADISE